ncbi:hypothetical protein Q0M34_14190, partial [Staphylococcus aureus]|nr:hypothetical protein [Staphylococcus aureus]
MAHFEHSDSIKEKKVSNHDQNIQGLWDSMKRPNLRITGETEENRQQQRHEPRFQDSGLLPAHTSHPGPAADVCFLGSFTSRSEGN